MTNVTDFPGGMSDSLGGGLKDIVVGSLGALVQPEGVAQPIAQVMLFGVLPFLVMFMIWIRYQSATPAMAGALLTSIVLILVSEYLGIRLIGETAGWGLTLILAVLLGATFYYEFLRKPIPGGLV